MVRIAMFQGPTFLESDDTDVLEDIWRRQAPQTFNTEDCIRSRRDG